MARKVFKALSPPICSMSDEVIDVRLLRALSLIMRLDQLEIIGVFEIFLLITCL